MTGKYKHIFFDLDHTLWDFNKNSTEVLLELYDEYRLIEFGSFSKEEFCSQFHEVNQRMWASFHRSGIDKNVLRNNRFNEILEVFGVENPEVSKKLADDYMKRCPAMHHTFPYALEVLHYLKNEKQYKLHIITNGFEDVQHVKLTSSRLKNYFHEVITADGSGFQKPHRQIFDYALAKIACTNDECLMVGDDLEADVLGAKNASIDQVFFNPSKVPHKETITFEISCLSELFKIL